MKTKLLILSIMMVFSAGTLFANGKSEKFEVKGNCGMCEKTIETAAKSVDGVLSADWSQETKIMTLSYDESKTDVNKVQKAIADAGYDTPLHRAKDEVYNKLHSCCKYDRSEEEK
jgi:periplasmic mercuric ion binding protein